MFKDILFIIWEYFIWEFSFLNKNSNVNEDTSNMNENTLKQKSILIFNYLVEDILKWVWSILIFN